MRPQTNLVPSFDSFWHHSGNRVGTLDSGAHNGGRFGNKQKELRLLPRETGGGRGG